MCLRPILIDNPNYQAYHLLDRNPFANVHLSRIAIPCGRCPVCLQLKQQYITQRVQMEALNHDLFFGTLTYNDDFLPRFIVEDFTLAYPDISDWQKMIKMIRKHENLPEFKYMLVSEYGGKRHRPHFHFILSFPRIDSDNLAQRDSFALLLAQIFLKYWRRNYGSTRSPDWKPLCTYYNNGRTRNFDLHYLNPYSSKNGLEDVAFYVSKYCLKYDKWLDKLKSKLFFSLSEADFTAAWDFLRPRRLMSKGFGSPYSDDVIAHIAKGVELALNTPSAKYPFFISPVYGNTFPLSPYYRSKLCSIDSELEFRRRCSDSTDSFEFDASRGVYIPVNLPSSVDFDLEDMYEKDRRFEIVKDSLNTRHTYFDDEANNINTQNFDDYETKVISHFSSDDFSSDDFFSSDS